MWNDRKPVWRMCGSTKNPSNSPSSMDTTTKIWSLRPMLTDDHLMLPVLSNSWPGERNKFVEHKHAHCPPFFKRNVRPLTRNVGSSSLSVPLLWAERAGRGRIGNEESESQNAKWQEVRVSSRLTVSWVCVKNESVDSLVVKLKTNNVRALFTFVLLFAAGWLCYSNKFRNLPCIDYYLATKPGPDHCDCRCDTCSRLPAVIRTGDTEDSIRSLAVGLNSSERAAWIRKGYSFWGFCDQSRRERRGCQHVNTQTAEVQRHRGNRVSAPGMHDAQVFPKKLLWTWTSPGPSSLGIAPYPLNISWLLKRTYIYSSN